MQRRGPSGQGRPVSRSRDALPWTPSKSTEPGICGSSINGSNVKLPLQAPRRLDSRAITFPDRWHTMGSTTTGLTSRRRRSMEPNPPGSTVSMWTPCRSSGTVTSPAGSSNHHSCTCWTLCPPARTARFACTLRSQVSAGVPFGSNRVSVKRQPYGVPGTWSVFDWSWTHTSPASRWAGSWPIGSAVAVGTSPVIIVAATAAMTTLFRFTDRERLSTVPPADPERLNPNADPNGPQADASPWARSSSTPERGGTRRPILALNRCRRSKRTAYVCTTRSRDPATRSWASTEPDRPPCSGARRSPYSPRWGASSSTTAGGAPAASDHCRSRRAPRPMSRMPRPCLAA